MEYKLLKLIHSILSDGCNRVTYNRIKDCLIDSPINIDYYTCEYADCISFASDKLEQEFTDWIVQ